jgi:predicted TIM-barrel fold metal-dependent hydrolase
MWHQGTSFVQKGPLEKSQPIFLDPVARSFPELRMIITHLGHPWIGEAISVVSKNLYVYTDISALSSRPWQMYNDLIEAIEYGIEDKLLFGTDFPFFGVEQTKESLMNLNNLVNGTNLLVFRRGSSKKYSIRNVGSVRIHIGRISRHENYFH